MSNLILVAGSNPPTTYLRALKTVGLNYKAHPFPNDLSLYSGLVLTGGGDVFPPFYDGNIDFSNENLIRDAREFQLIDHFFNKNLPILGICRGMQVLNVFFGGTLKNVRGHEGGKIDAVHEVIPPEKGFLKGLKLVNSNHRQADPFDSVRRGMNREISFTRVHRIAAEGVNLSPRRKDQPPQKIRVRCPFRRAVHAVFRMTAQERGCPSLTKL